MAFAKAILSAFLLLSSLFVSITNAAYPITGPTGGVHPRLEIRQLFKNTNQFNLYLLALVQFQGNQQDFITSWFSIGAIHGAPAQDFDGVGRTAPGIGYCTHGINLFPIWHRPYIALFEQKLQQAAVFIAGTFSGSDRTMYQNLAQTLRSPYFDWAAAPANGNTWPLVMSAKYITVTRPNGQETIINPLFRYNYHPGPNPSPYGAPWTNWFATLRNPQVNGAPSNDSNAVSNNDVTAATLNNNRISQRQSVYNWFTLCPNYDEISNDGPSGSTPECHISLESLHNNIHVWIGGNGNGHMTIVPVSAHDPSFMLHHTMIDRLFAMWQVLYPNSWITNQQSQVETWTISKGSVQGPGSPLTPFHRNAQGDFWTPDQSRNMRVFGYTYPEMANSDGSANAIRGYINRLYGPNASATAGSSKKRDVEQAEVEERDLGTFITNTTSAVTAAVPLNMLPSVPVAVTTATNGSTYQYIANIQTSRWQLGESYVIYLFFGSPTTENPNSWGADPKMVGSYGVFSGPGMLMNNMLTTSTVPLTDALIKAAASGALATLAQPLVITFLKANLQWRIATANGEVLDPASVPNFLISVVSSTMKAPATENSFPVWSKFHTLTQITSAKAGGAQTVDQALNMLSKRDKSDIISGM